MLETWNGIWTCLSCWLDSCRAITLRLVTLCVFWVVLFPTATGRRKMWLYLPGCLLEHQWTSASPAIIMTPALSFRVSCCKSSVQRSRETSLLCSEFIVRLRHFSCAGWEDSSCRASLAQDQQKAVLMATWPVQQGYAVLPLFRMGYTWAVPSIVPKGPQFVIQNFMDDARGWAMIPESSLFICFINLTNIYSLVLTNV